LPAEQARRRQRNPAAGGFLQLPVDVMDGLRELPVQALQAAGERTEVVARAGEGGGRQQQGQHGNEADGAHGVGSGWTGGECAAGSLNRRENGKASLPRIYTDDADKEKTKRYAHARLGIVQPFESFLIRVIRVNPWPKSF